MSKALRKHNLDSRPNLRGRVWENTLPGSFLSAGMLPSVLTRERASLQPMFKFN